MNLATLLPKVIAIARKAGSKTLEYYQNPRLKITQKSDHSPITQADLAAHNIITDSLQSLTPVYPVLSEESDLNAVIPALGEPFWLVDPLDGTKEFIHQTDEFTINIALIDQAKPVLGVVYAPCLDRMYAGILKNNHHSGIAVMYHQGREHTLLPRSLTAPLSNTSLRVLMSRRHGRTRLNALLQSLEHTFQCLEPLAVGSSLKLCYLAEGKADFYPRLGPTHIWDTAAAHAVLAASGGDVINQQGQRLQYRPCNTLKNPYFFAVGDPSIDWSNLLTLDRKKP